MNEKFEFHLKTIIKRLFKQVLISSILTIIFVVGGLVSLYYDRLEISVISFLFAVLFLSMVIIDFIHLRSNRNSLENYDENKEVIARRLNRQYRMYVARGRGITKLISRYAYSSLIAYYEYALDALEIENQIKI